MIEVLTPLEMSRADRLSIESGIAGIKLMERAGRAVADAVAFRHALGARVLVICGPGNNGGDGFVAARILSERGYRVRLALLGRRDRLAGDAALAAAMWNGPIGPADQSYLKAALAESSVVVDALFGAGLTRPLAGEAAEMVEAVNRAGRPIVAVDLPSGVDGATGAAIGPAIQADTTVTFFRLKLGHLLMPGRARCGATIVADIGIPNWVLREIGPKHWRNQPDLWRGHLVAPALKNHKFDRGHAVIVSGPPTRTGAARLAAMAALRAGSGLVTLASPPDAILVNAAHLTAVMLARMDGAAGLTRILSDRRMNAVVLGPALGVGEGTRDLVAAALGAGRGVVIDADGLTSYAERPAALFEAILGSGSPVILTPHEGEFARIFPRLSAREPLPRTERARAAARESGAAVILKGPDTVIAAPDGRLAINDNAPADLATAGSGDVLAGIAGGLLARGMPAFEAAAAAVWMHGDCGRRAGPGLIAEDLAAELRPILVDLYRENALDARATPREPTDRGDRIGFAIDGSD